MQQIWIKKYFPTKKDELFGNSGSYSLLKDFVQNYSKKSKPLFIYGGVGNGKTSAVYSVANELGYELVELNASDSRSSSSISELLSGVLNQGSLFGASKLILIDELDGLSGTKDRGAVPLIAKSIVSSKYPVVLVSQDAYDDKLKPLRKISELVEFLPLSSEEIYLLLKKICVSEKVSFEEDALQQIARISGGDARAAVNDLQSIVSLGKISKESVSFIGERNTTKKIENALTRIFKTTDISVALPAFDDVTEDLDQVFLWVEENLPKEYLDPEHLSFAFDNISLADVFRGRIRRWQYYRFYVYCYNLMTAGIALAKDKKYSSKIKYSPTSRLLKIWIYNNANAKKKSIAQKVAAKTHTSQRSAFSSVVPFLQVIFKNNKALSDKFSKEFDFVEEEISWLKTK